MPLVQIAQYPCFMYEQVINNECVYVGVCLVYENQLWCVVSGGIDKRCDFSEQVEWLEGICREYRIDSIRVDGRKGWGRAYLFKEGFELSHTEVQGGSTVYVYWKQVPA